MSHRQYLALLAGLLAAEFVWLGIAPHDRAAWALENALVLVFALALGFSQRRLPLSRVSYTLIFAFLALHEIGAHYTYSDVPYDAWFQSAFGVSLDAMLGWERNNFDRVVHF